MNNRGRVSIESSWCTLSLIHAACGRLIHSLIQVENKQKESQAVSLLVGAFDLAAGPHV